MTRLQSRWNQVTGPVISSYTRLSEAATYYGAGDFKTLAAQESDWLDRQEKKLERNCR